MTSPRMIAANRANGRKSRGPKTAAGKARASRNALRHGLTTISSHNPAYRAEIEELAKALCEGETHPLLYQRALAVAQADVLLRHIRLEKVAAIERRKEDLRESELVKPPEMPRQNGANDLATPLHVATAAAHEDEAKAPASPQTAVEDAPQQMGAAQQQGVAQQVAAVQQETQALHAALPDLEILTRYESRAWYRRDKAVGEFIDVMSALAEGILTAGAGTVADARSGQFGTLDQHVSRVAQSAGGNQMGD